MTAPQHVQYFVLTRGTDPDERKALLRKRPASGGGCFEEVFGRSKEWRGTTLLGSYDHGSEYGELIAITEEEADAIVAEICGPPDAPPSGP